MMRRAPRSGSWPLLPIFNTTDLPSSAASPATGGQYHEYGISISDGRLDRDPRQSGSSQHPAKRGHRPVYTPLKSYYLSNGPYPSYSDGLLPLAQPAIDAHDSSSVASISSSSSSHENNSPGQYGAAAAGVESSGSPPGNAAGNSPHYSSNSNNAGGAAIKSRLVIRTTEGAIMGTRVDNKVNKPYLSFSGIPYAEAPLGNLRFQSPRRHRPWDGIKMTMAFKDACLGYVFRTVVGDEDCLYLNVFVPDDDEDGSGSTESNSRGHPVVFWIHGGAFIHGGEVIPWLYPPGTFTDRGLIFITIGYRLGPIGFLSTNDAVIPGNFGFKDMVMGLKWVKRNIHKFGGDPNNVHIMGQSGGAVAVHALSLSPMARGLFTTAISMSGSLFVLWGQNPDGRPLANYIAHSLDCPTSNSHQILECLKKRGAKEITAKIQEFFFLGIRYAVPLGLVVDKHAPDPFMPEHPLTILSQKRFQPVPYIFGTVPKEMALFLPGVVYDQRLHDLVTSDWENECGRTIYSHLYLEEVLPSREETAPLCKRARELYFDNGPIDPPGDEAMKLVRFTGDSSIRAGVYTAALLQAKYSDAPVYVYSWGHKNQGALNLLSVINFLFDNRVQLFFTNTTRQRSLRLEPGQSHTDDLFLLFDPPKTQKLTNHDIAVKSFATSMFQSYWSTGTPRANGTTWPEFNENSQKYLTFEASPNIAEVLISSERVRLYADWYDLYHGHQRLKQRMAPSMATLLFGPANQQGSSESTEGHFEGTYGHSYSYVGSDPSNFYEFHGDGYATQNGGGYHGHGGAYVAPSTGYGSSSSSASGPAGAISYGIPLRPASDLDMSFHRQQRRHHERNNNNNRPYYSNRGQQGEGSSQHLMRMLGWKPWR